MELNKKNWLGMYYNLVYGDYPNDVCSFFWGTLLIVLLSPIMSIGGFMNKSASYSMWSDKTENFFKSLLWGIVIYALYGMLLSMGASIYGSYIGMSETHFTELYNLIGGLKFFLLIPLLGIGMLLIVALSIAIIAGICAGVKWIYDKIVEKKEESNVKVPYAQNVGDFVGAVKGKYCCRIIWKD